jgi:hypothetical protein
MSLGNSSVHQSGEIPEITKLPNGRIRVIRRFVKFTREDVDNVNLGSLLGDFGDSDTTGEQVANQGYSNCRLIEVEVETSTKRSSGSDSSNSVLVQTYETLTSSFVEITDPTVSIAESGLKQITKVYRAISGTASSGVIGVTQLTSGEFLASSQIEDNTAFAELTQVYLEAGVLSETLDNVGSQKTIVIETIGTDPATPNEYVLASKQESDFEGFQTNRFTFLKSDVELSITNDKVGSQLAITIEQFNGTPLTPSGYLLANTQESDVDGIPTKRYTFLKNDVQLSESEDKVGSQLAISQQWFNPANDKTKSGYSLASKNTSDFDGIKTVEFRFLKDNTELSRSEDKVGSQLAITTEVFKPASDPTESGYSVARTEVSDVDGIPTKRFTFLKDDAELSRSEDKVGSQLAITTEVFKPASDPVESGYSVARTEVSDVDGIPTKRFTFLKDNAVLSRSIQTKNGGYLIIEVVEVFNGTPVADTAGAVKIGDEVSDVDGIPTRRFTFAKGDGQISVDSRPAPAQLAGCTYVTVRSLGTPVTPTGVLVAESETESDGYITYEKTALQGTIIGTKQTYKDVVEVTDAGIVNCTQVSKAAGGISGTIAVTQVTPPRTKTLAATVTVEVTTSPPNTIALAYDLGEISCSVTSISMSENFRGTDVFTTESGNSRFSGQRKTADMSARISTYPNCYLSSSTGGGTFSYTSSYENTSTSPNTLVTAAQTSTTKTFTDGTGSTAATYATTGVVRRDSRPILTSLDGTIYFEVVTWTV